MLISAVFFGSVLVGRPIVNRLARDFCPLTDEAASRHGVLRLFRNLTLFWSLVLLTHATLMLSLLLTLSTDNFVATKTMAGPADNHSSDLHHRLVRPGGAPGGTRTSEPSNASARAITG